MSNIKYIAVCIVAAFLACFTLVSCTDKPVDAKSVDSVPPIYPDYVGVTIPVGICPLDFNVVAPDVTSVYVVVKGKNGDQLVASGKYANFDVEKWHGLTQANAGESLSVEVYAKANGEWTKYKPFDIYISQYALDEWGVTYRRVAPGYEVYSKMGIYQRNLSDFNEYPIIENTLTSGQCYNCHTANRTNPDQFLMHVRGDHGATMIQQAGKRSWLKAINDSLGGAMVYPYWHPSGRYCAFSTNQTRQGFHIAGDKRLEVFDQSSDVLVYDIERHEIILDSLLSSKSWSENIPVFSPDGKYLYFTTCLQKSYPLEYKDEKYNLCRVGFDESTGRIVGEVDTLFNAVELGKSVTWPRPSYDGKYLMFTLIDYGYFSIWHKEADQWLLDLSTGEARSLKEINSDDADSFHNWNVNSHWVVFTSRRDDGLYSRLYLAAINDKGQMTKPFMLPQRDPLNYYQRLGYSYNTPDFTARRVDFDGHEAAREVLSDNREATTIRR